MFTIYQLVKNLKVVRNRKLLNSSPFFHVAIYLVDFYHLDGKCTGEAILTVRFTINNSVLLHTFCIYYCWRNVLTYILNQLKSQIPINLYSKPIIKYYHQLNLTFYINTTIIHIYNQILILIKKIKLFFFYTFWLVNIFFYKIWKFYLKSHFWELKLFIPLLKMKTI